MGCKGCGKKGSFSLMGKDLGSVTCPACKKKTKKDSIYHSWCGCGAHLDIDGRTGKIKHCYPPAADVVPETPKAPKAPKEKKGK